MACSEPNLISICPPLIESITEKGLFVIVMFKQMKQIYQYNDKPLNLDDLFKLVPPTLQKKDVLWSIQVRLQTDRQTSIKIVFVRNRNKKSEWLAILSTDIALIRRRNCKNLWHALGHRNLL